MEAFFEWERARQALHGHVVPPPTEVSAKQTWDGFAEQVYRRGDGGGSAGVKSAANMPRDPRWYQPALRGPVERLAAVKQFEAFCSHSPNNANSVPATYVDPIPAQRPLEDLKGFAACLELAIRLWFADSTNDAIYGVLCRLRELVEPQIRNNVLQTKFPLVHLHNELACFRRILEQWKRAGGQQPPVNVKHTLNAAAAVVHRFQSVKVPPLVNLLATSDGSRASAAKLLHVLDELLLDLPYEFPASEALYRAFPNVAPPSALLLPEAGAVGRAADSDEVRTESARVAGGNHGAAESVEDEISEVGLSYPGGSPPDPICATQVPSRLRGHDVGLPKTESRRSVKRSHSASTSDAAARHDADVGADEDGVRVIDLIRVTAPPAKKPKLDLLCGPMVDAPRGCSTTTGIGNRSQAGTGAAAVRPTTLLASSSGGGGSGAGTAAPPRSRVSDKPTAANTGVVVVRATASHPYPCRSRYHAKYSTADKHASQECPFCTVCHLMEILFNGVTTLCCWQHQPTPRRIQLHLGRFPDLKSKADKRLRDWSAGTALPRLDIPN